MHVSYPVLVYKDDYEDILKNKIKLALDIEDTVLMDLRNADYAIFHFIDNHKTDLEETLRCARNLHFNISEDKNGLYIVTINKDKVQEEIPKHKEAINKIINDSNFQLDKLRDGLSRIFEFSKEAGSYFVVMTSPEVFYTEIFDDIYNVNPEPDTEMVLIGYFDVHF